MNRKFVPGDILEDCKTKQLYIISSSSCNLFIHSSNKSYALVSRIGKRIMSVDGISKDLDVIISPYRGLQEIYRHDPWKILICCVLLNLTYRDQVDKVIDELFIKYPSFFEMANADYDELQEIIRSTGLSSVKATRLIQISKQFVQNPGVPLESYVSSLPGIGTYAQQSFEIFYMRQFPDRATDHFLKLYLEWHQNLLEEIPIFRQTYQLIHGITKAKL